MSQAARVLSVQALRDFRVSMIKFVEEARNALSGVDMELKRTRDWLERDQLGYWQMQVKRRQEAVMNARAELHKRQIAAKGSDSISDTEQKEALREAQRRLRIAEEKVQTVKRLVPIFQHAMAEYKSCASPLNDHLSGGIDKSLARLEHMVRSLEEYLALQAPATQRAAPLGSAATSSGGSSSASTSAAVGSPAESESSGGDESTPAADAENGAAAEKTEAEETASPSPADK